ASTGPLNERARTPIDDPRGGNPCHLCHWGSLLLLAQEQSGLHRRHFGRAANDGQDTRAIQHYLGHRSIASTVRYTHSSPEGSRGSGRTEVGLEGERPSYPPAGVASWSRKQQKDPGRVPRGGPAVVSCPDVVSI